MMSTSCMMPPRADIQGFLCPVCTAAAASHLDSHRQR
jgi:hypothetical protein